MGKLFVIDGTDGSGKQTQSAKLKERLEKEGIKVIDDKVDLKLYQWKEKI